MLTAWAPLACTVFTWRLDARVEPVTGSLAEQGEDAFGIGAVLRSGGQADRITNHRVVHATRRNDIANKSLPSVDLTPSR